MEPARTVHRQSWRAGTPSSGRRSIPEETAVAVTYNGGTYAVMMTTPQDLEDFALGFSLSEGIINSVADIGSLDIVHLDDGVELRMWLSQPRADRLKERRRRMAGPTGCGLCGIESIAEAMRPTATIGQGGQFSPGQIMAAMEGLPARQVLNIETRAVAASEGIVLLTSRVSVEMVQKTAAIGAPAMVSVSAPTALAVRMADAAGITLAAIARKDGFEVFTHPCRIS
jgi:FdhD protein